MNRITSIEALEEIYGTPGANATAKESEFIIPTYREFIAASPYCALATVGPEGLDCSPRGDLGSVVTIKDERTVLLPDRAGNNRIDSLRNIVRDKRVALLFMVPGSNTTLRINGEAEITDDEALRTELAVEGKLPRSVIIITVKTIYFQCARALIRSKLWDESVKIDPKTLPTPGDMLKQASSGQVGGEQYDREWPARAAKTMW